MSRWKNQPRCPPTPTATPATTTTPQVTPTPTVTPFPMLASEDSGLPEGLYTESDDLVRLAVALSPALLLATIVAVVKLVWRWRLLR